MTTDTKDPNLEMIEKELNRLVEKSQDNALSNDDLKKLESLLKMRTLIVDKPSVVYYQDYSDIYDRTILATIKKKKPTTKKKVTKKKVSKKKTTKKATKKKVSKAK